MHITTRGQITIPQDLRQKYQISTASELMFVEENDRIYIAKLGETSPSRGRFEKLRGKATIKMSTEEILALTRGDE